MKNSEKILSTLRAAVEKSPENAPLRRHLAETLLGYGFAAEAEHEFQAALALEPRSPEVKVWLAQAMLQQGKHKAALKEEIRLKIIHPLAHRELFEACGQAAGGGILLYGPPGCGKTLMARATAGEIQSPFVSVGINEVLDMCPLWKNEDIHDLKLLADSVIANGVNQIVWHGMPFHTPGDGIEFYAGTHVGPDSGFVASIPAFNRYLSDVCAIMQSGSPYTNLAVYLPNEDNWVDGGIPDRERTPGASHRWEMRHVRPPAETSGFHPVWVSCPFLQKAVVANKRMRIGECDFQALYVDCTWLDHESLCEISRLAGEGLPVVLTKRPKQPGRRSAASYEERVEELLLLDNVVSGMPATGVKPLIHSDPIPPYWARCVNQDVYVFVAHPAAGDIRFPMRRGQAREAAPVAIDMLLTWGGHSTRITVELESHASKVLELHPRGDLAVKTWRI
jgi:DNA polymerase III delta prime subunit